MNCRAPGLPGLHARARAGLTLTNVLVSMAVSMMVMGAVVSSHLFGLRLFERAKIKLNASGDDPRKFYQLAADLASVKLVRVGQGGPGSFTEAAANSPQQGSALQIYPTTDTNVFIQYYLDAMDRALKRRALDATVSTIAQSISNTVIFRIEDLSGVVLTNSQNHSVLGVDLQLSAVGDPANRLGAGRTFSGYRVQTKFAVRAPD